MDTTRNPERLEQRRDEIRAELSSIGDLRPGSLVGRFRKCGKPNCHCAKEEGGGHGPSWSLTRRIGGKTATRIIPPAAVEQTKEQIAEYKRLRRLTQELVEVSEGICEAQLAVGSGTAGGAKKRASGQASKRKSSPRSRHS